MNFDTSNRTFRQLLGHGLRFRVPPFQRDYSWTEDEWDDLWQDILDMGEPDGDPAHYLGYLVLQSSDNKCFDIIDGQQRLTTISLMILAMLKRLKELAEAGQDAENNLKRKEQLQNSYIGFLDPVTLVSQSKLELNRHNNRFYQNYLIPLGSLPLRGLNASEHQLRKAFLWYGQRVVKMFPDKRPGSGRDLTLFLDTLVDKLFFTVITVTDELNAFKVFETLNARGVRLSASDLLKNHLFSLISAENVDEAEMKTLEDSWENIVSLLGNDSFQDFLRVFWNSRHKLVRKSDLFKTIKKSVTAREQAFELLRGLDLAAGVFAALREAIDPSWNRDEREALKCLHLFNVQQPLPILLAGHASFFDKDRAAFTRIIKALVIVSFRYNVICNQQTHDQEGLYNEIALKISDGTYRKIYDVLTALKAVYPEDEQFKTAFTEKELRTTTSRNRKVARYILFELERQRSGQDFDVESAGISLEHILPENPTESWSAIDETTQEHLLYRLGNMTLLETAANRDLGNADYPTKLAAYRQSAFQITRAVAEHYETWDDRKVEARQKQLANVAATIWKIDFGR
ncbi:MAG: DUF262 domain-containing HNH endonuclease family protein [Candidatus Adiutrix sp.]|nr:DUF262 domain-containing HNH endonuclease family protein [Candidatus Adiutrix sp.]